MKKNFKLKVILLLVLILISANIGLKASHIIGAEINYKHVNGNLYLFTLKVYRDCNECKFDNNGGGSNGGNCPEVPNLKVRGGLNTFYSGQDFGDVVMTRTKIEDKTPSCYTSISKCKSGSTMNYGFELQEFEGSFNFTGLLLTGKCEFDVSIGIPSRNAAINSSGTEQNFFNFASLNLCNGINNQSTRFELDPVFTLIQNQTHSIALGVVNDDNDSLSFKLRSALVNRNINVTYNIGRGYNQPYAVYCTSGINCPPSPNAPLAEGFYVSGLTGDIVFTPTLLNEGGVIVVECEEWKKDNNGKSYLAGVTRRDIYAEVITATNNLPKIKNNELFIDQCEGFPFSYKLNTDDIKLYGPLADSVQVNLITDLKDIVLTNDVMSLPPYNFYHFDLANTLNKRGVHYITINAVDNNCPLRGRNSKTIILNILKNRSLEYTYQTKNCGLLLVENKLKNQPVRWSLYDLNNKLLKNQIGLGLTYQLTNGGKYILKASLDATDNLCAVNITDTIDVKNFVKPELELGSDQLVCNRSDINIVPSVFKTYDAFKVLLDNKEVQLPYDFKADGSRKFLFKVMQDDGCFAEDIINVNVHPELTRTFIKDTICSNFEGVFDLDNIIKADRSKIDFIDITCTSSSVDLSRIDNLNWGLKIQIPGNEKLSFATVITDINKCNYLDNFTLDMVVPKPINLLVNDKICANADPLTLPSGLNGTWKCINYPANINGNQLTIEPYAGLMELQYSEVNKCISTKDYTITVLDTTAIALLTGKDLILCENAAPVILSATPANGKWEGGFVSQGVFYPLSARNTKNILQYKYANTAGCISRDNLTIEVIGLPVLTLESNKATICFGDELKLTANTGTSKLDGYWFSNGDGRFDNPGKTATTYLPSVNDVKKGIVNFTYTIQTNTVCGNVTQGIDISIVETPSGDIVQDYSLSKCEPAQFRFETTFKNVTKQNWYINDSLTEEFEYALGCNVVLKAGTYKIKTEVMNGECVATVFTQPIEVYSTPATNFIANPNYKLSREYPRLYLKDITRNRNPFSSKWYFNNDLIDESKEFYYNVETANDTFSIKLVNVSSAGGCENSMTRQFIFTPINQLYIPDAFSPDTKGPDENNEFKVKGPPMQFFYIEIYNKWGGMVYFSKDMNASWDGTYGGKPALPGVYFYKINSTDFDGLSRDYSGTITLIR